MKERIATPNFKGVLLLSRDPEDPIADDVAAPGAIFTEVESDDDDPDDDEPRTVTVSAPFAIRMVEMEKPWIEDGWQEDYPEVEE